MSTLITDIAANVASTDDPGLDALIADYLGAIIPADQAAVDQWRLVNYADLRRWAYPDKAEFLDAMVKTYCSDPAVQAAGQDQLALYVSDCLAVKTRFPKG